MDNIVLIVGAGPVGLTLAACLNRCGVSFRIIEQKARAVSTSNATALQARSLELFSIYGIAPELISEGVWSEAVELHGGGRMLAHVDFKDIESPFPGLLALPQSSTERILNRYLAAQGVPVERTMKFLSFEQSASSVRSTLEHNDGSKEIVESEWLVGCDGANSLIRDLIGSRFEPLAPMQRFLLADLKISWSFPPTQFSAFFHPDGAAYVAPGLHNRHRLVLDVTTQPEAFDHYEPTLELLRSLFSKRVPVAAHLSDLSWISGYEVQPSLASTYRKERVFLAGDAVHTFLPAGSPGFNAGLQDAFNLGWKLALARNAEKPENVLDSYQTERLQAMRASSALYRNLLETIESRKPSASHLNHLALPLLSGWNVLEHLPSGAGSQNGIHYRASDIVERNGRFSPNAPHSGDRAPVSSIAGRSLLDLIEGACHTLFFFTAGNDSPEHISLLSAIRRDFEAAYPNLIRGYVITKSLRALGKDLLHDSEGRLHSAFGADMPCFYLIRPDAYIAYQSEPPDGAALHRFLREAYGLAPLHHRSRSSAGH